MEFPLCLTEIGGTSVLERIVQNTASIWPRTYTFAFSKSEAQRFYLERIAALLAPGARSTLVPSTTQGSACTALLSACSLDPESELLVVSANELVDVDFGEALAQFRERRLDGGTWVFRSIHPRYSYVRLDADGFIVEAAQRMPVSANATAGAFWFARTADFVAGAMDMIRKSASVDGLYFVAPVFNELILKQRRLGVLDLDPARYLPLKNERLVAQLSREQQR
jgi:hypothetical protein